jgi:hypothetical protein
MAQSNAREIEKAKKEGERMQREREKRETRE